MIDFDKNRIKDQLTLDNYFSILEEFGGEPEYTNFGIVSKTICHNNPYLHDASKKLYLYDNSRLFYCYTGCDNFDLYELIIKVHKIQKDIDMDLNDAVRYVAYRFGYLIESEYVDLEVETSEDWKVLENYKRIQSIDKTKSQQILLKEYDEEILNKFNYSVKINPWLKEDISQEALELAKIGFYPGGNQITIPHFDQNNRFIGLRGRVLGEEEASLYGKYRPLKVNKILYNHPLGMNLYNLNNSKNNISAVGKAIVLEGEKSALKYQSYFGIDNDISVACCGSNVSNYQIELLKSYGAKEVIIAMDRQFKQLNDEEFKHLVKKLKKLHTKYKNDVLISFMFDKDMITGYKDSPIDCGPDIFLKLFKERVIL